MLNYFVQKTKQLKGQETLHPDEIEAQKHGWTYKTGYSRGYNDGGIYGNGFYEKAFPLQSEAMRGYREGYDDARRKRKR